MEKVPNLAARPELKAIAEVIDFTVQKLLDEREKDLKAIMATFQAVEDRFDSLDEKVREAVANALEDPEIASRLWSMRRRPSAQK